MSIVAIVIPTHISKNGQRHIFLDKCLESLISQGDQAIGLVIDDSSSFDVKSKVESFNSNNLRYFKRKRKPDLVKKSVIE